MKKFLILALLAPFFISAHGEANEEHIIRMTSGGFEPKELTITQGDVVVFINNDDVDRWPASNFHPTHAIYPEFDPQKGVAPGASWKFKFEKVGTWRMHDHLSPHMTGAITVVEGEKEVSEGPTLENPGFWAKLKAFFSRLFGKS